MKKDNKLQLPFISVIIPAYNRANMIGKTIESFVNQSYPKDRYEIIISDNNSTDNTKDIVEQIAKQSEVKIIYHFEGRQGVHFARNSAAKLAKGEILYYTDDDMVADKELLIEIVRCFEDEKVGSATGKVLPMWESDPPEWVLKLCQNAYLSLHDRGDHFFISDDDFGVYSCHMAIRKDVFFECGGFNPENTAGEWIGDGETGLNIKVKEKGYKFGYNGRSIIYHMILPSRMTQEYLNKRLANQGNCDCYTEFKKHRFTREQLLQRIQEYSIKIIEHTFYATQKKKAGDITWRINEAYRYYYMNRIQYDCRLMMDKDWQELVLKDNWIDE
ncbi:MAG: glycosyltransferase [Thermodesulfovibrionales bacterium]|nr:glycosyltransferase [Thermodesulfovibrionales bacterium]